MNFRISWSKVEMPKHAELCEVFYIVERRCPPSRNWIEIASELKDSHYLMKEYHSEKDYMFRVKARNKFGVSEPTMATTLYAKLGGIIK